MTDLIGSECPCGRSPDPGVKGPNGYYRRRFATGDEAEQFIRGLYSIDALNTSGKVMWTEGE